MKVILAGGGTGGHLYPGIAVAERLKEVGISSLFLVSDRGIEKRILDRLGYEYVEQHLSGFSGVSIGKKLKALTDAYTSAGKAAKYVENVDKILVLGGFAAASATFAGWRSKAEVYIHEQNSVMGLVNRVAACNARKIFLSYPDTVHAPSRAITVGNPVRKELLNGEIKQSDEKNILLIGGSQGSRVLNKVMAASASILLEMGFKIVHQTGEKLYEETAGFYEEAGITGDAVKILPYITDMAKAYQEADIVVARSGSGSVFEITYAKRPAIYVPFAQATKNHQFYNALSMKKKGYCEIVNENSLNKQVLIEHISCMYADIDKYKVALEKVVPLDSAALIIKNMNIDVNISLTGI